METDYFGDWNLTSLVKSRQSAANCKSCRWQNYRQLHITAGRTRPKKCCSLISKSISPQERGQSSVINTRLNQIGLTHYSNGGISLIKYIRTEIRSLDSMPFSLICKHQTMTQINFKFIKFKLILNQSNYQIFHVNIICFKFQIFC